MGISSASAISLAASGANIEVTAEANFSSASVIELTKAVVASSGHIKIHAGSYSSASLKKFVELGGARVTIVL